VLAAVYNKACTTKSHPNTMNWGLNTAIQIFMGPEFSEKFGNSIVNQSVFAF
jgi:hypothetical protein